MIKKMRLKFVTITMISLSLVLFLIVGAINLLHYENILSEADISLDYLYINDGKFPSEEPTYPPIDPPAGEEEEIEDDEIKSPFDSPEDPFSTRFFSVTFYPDGQVVSDLSNIAAINDENATQMAAAAATSGKSYGFISNYRFKAIIKDEFVRVVFLDYTNELLTCRDFLLLSATISIAGLLLVFFIILLLSGKIIKPFIESHEKQKRFITDAGHDIKTPITVIEADAELIDIEYPDCEWVSDIKKQTKRLASLTSDLIYLARMEEGHSTAKDRLCISDIIADEASSFSALSATDGKSYLQDILPELYVVGNEKDIRRLVSILLDNAFKYSGEGGEVFLTLSKSIRHISLEIKNTATNLSDEGLHRLFERFWRGDSSRSSGGFGIGLSMAEAIALAHDGKIHAKKDGDMLSVTVILPASIA